MNKLLRRIFTVTVALATVFTMNAISSANEILTLPVEISEIDCEDDLTFMSKDIYQLNEDVSVTVYGYSDNSTLDNHIFAADNGIALLSSGKSSTKSVKYHCVFSGTGSGQSWDWLEMWIWGTFEYNEDKNTVYVKNCGSDIEILISNYVLVSDSGTGYKNNKGGIFKHYATVSREIVMNNTSGKNKTFKMELKMKSDGQVSCSPKYSEKL